MLLFLNNDVEMSPGSLRSLVRQLEIQPTAGACQPTLRDADGQLDSAGSYFTKTGFLHHVTEEELTTEGLGAVTPRFALKGACFLVRRDAYISAGGFDRSYFAYFEETDLCWRMVLAGWQLLHVANTVVVHGGGRTTTRLFSSDHIDYLSFRNRLTTLRKNTELPLRLRVLPRHVAICVATGVLFLLNGKPQNCVAIFRALAWHLAHGREIRRTRAQMVPYRKLPDSAIEGVTVRAPLEARLRLLRQYLVRW